MRAPSLLALGIALSFAMALALSACGRYGPPSQPGPPSKITYPKFYPQPTPQTP